MSHITLARGEDDYGIDLFCTLTKAIGQRAVVSDYYSVQVKSTSEAWTVEGNDAVKWLVEYPTPLFLACVDKRAGILSVYRTLARFLAGFREPQGRLELIPTDDDEGKCAQSCDETRFELSAPILRVTIADFMSEERLAHLRTVLQFWVNIDQENCVFRKMGLLRLREPHSYRVNEVPDTDIVEQGNIMPSAAQLRMAILTMVEVLDCVAHQLLQDGDREAALQACLLLNHVRKSRSDLFADNLRWRTNQPWSLEMVLSRELQAVLHPEQELTYVLQDLDEISRQVTQTPLFARFVSSSKAQF